MTREAQHIACIEFGATQHCRLVSTTLLPVPPQVLISRPCERDLWTFGFLAPCRRPPEWRWIGWEAGRCHPLALCIEAATLCACFRHVVGDPGFSDGVIYAILGAWGHVRLCNRDAAVST